MLPTSFERIQPRPATLMFALLVGCAGAGNSPSFLPTHSSIVPRNATIESYFRLPSKIQHVIIVIQENRTPDNLFRGLPGADTIGPATLTPMNLAVPYDLSHTHQAFRDNDAGQYGPAALGYVRRTQVAPYFAMAEQYAFADRMFQTNEGPSFPAHQYLVSGTSTIARGSNLRVAENPEGGGTTGPIHEGGCDSTAPSLVKLIDENGSESQTTYPCFDRPSLTDLLDARGLTWRYYEAFTGAGLWNGLDAIKHVHDSSEYTTNVVAPSSKVLTDVANGTLANVTWVTPTAAESDHANITDGTGPSWVAAIVNTVGKSRYWNSTAIIITWDDWGGWYDHVKPTRYNVYELGMRVPLLVISPYAKAGYVSHQQHEFGSILKFAEETFELGSLNATDVRSDDLSDCFDFLQTPRRFKTIPAPLPASYFLHQGVSMVSPDDDR